MDSRYETKFEVALEAIARDGEALIATVIAAKRISASSVVRIGTEEYNADFSAEEARAFVDYLQHEYAIPRALDAVTKRIFEVRIHDWIPQIRRAVIRATN